MGNGAVVDFRSGKAKAGDGAAVGRQFPAFPEVCQPEKLPIPPITSLREFYRRNANVFVKAVVCDLGKTEAKSIAMEILRAIEKHK